MDLISRATATQATIDQFFDKDFSWGSADCAILACQHLANLNIDTPLDKVKGYKTERGAKRALVKLGVKGMEDLADAQGFDRIAPASALMGDLVAFPGGTEDDEWLALGVAIGNNMIIGFANGKCMRGPISVATLAWRVN